MPSFLMILTDIFQIRKRNRIISFLSSRIMRLKEARRWKFYTFFGVNVCNLLAYLLSEKKIDVEEGGTKK